MSIRKICIVTSTRADYGLLTPLMKEINNDEYLKLQIIALGMHLSEKYGLTYTSIENDGFKIDKKLNTLIYSNDAIGISKTMSLTQTLVTEALHELNPDIVVILGDRFEILSVAVSAMILKIPIAHLSGGELTFGAIDDAIRHSITKISHIHFVATEEYKKRVIQLGEDEKHIYNFGEAGLDNILNLKLLSKNEFENSIDRKLSKKNLLITYHPTTLDSIDKIRQDFKNILESLDGLQDTLLIFTKANCDEGGELINKMIDKYIDNNSNKSLSFISLGQLRYLSALQYVDAVVGNTSSGIVEAPSFNIGTINIGSRQDGRVQAMSVINCDTSKESIKEAFKTLYSEEFQKNLPIVTNPYYQHNSSYKTKEVLKNIDLRDILYKRFKDLV